MKKATLLPRVAFFFFKGPVSPILPFMRVAILSRNKSLHSIRRLAYEFRKAGVQFDVINPLECQLVIDGKESKILLGHSPLPYYDAVLPRIGASITEYGLAVVKQFEALGMKTVNSAQAIAQSRDKMKCLQVLLEAGIAVPSSVLTRNFRSLRAAVEAIHGFPVVVKLLEGTQGVGVMLLPTPIALGSVLDTLRGMDRDVILQQFIKEGAGQDFRAFVIGGKVIAAMVRTAPEGEFRTNIHRGGLGKLIQLSTLQQRIAVRAAKTLGLGVAGVDIMESSTGPVVIEVNSSPGFEGIEKATGLNIAAAIVRHVKTLRSHSARRRSARRT